MATFQTLFVGNIGQPASVGGTPTALPLAKQIASAHKALRVAPARMAPSQARSLRDNPARNRLSVPGEAVASVALGRDMAYPLAFTPRAYCAAIAAGFRSSPPVGRLSLWHVVCVTGIRRA
jgi:hypothetical protein